MRAHPSVSPRPSCRVSTVTRPQDPRTRDSKTIIASGGGGPLAHAREMYTSSASTLPGHEPQIADKTQYMHIVHTSAVPGKYERLRTLVLCVDILGVCMSHILEEVLNCYSIISNDMLWCVEPVS